MGNWQNLAKKLFTADLRDWRDNNAEEQHWYALCYNLMLWGKKNTEPFVELGLNAATLPQHLETGHCSWW